jgi:hypothetical protein
VAARRQGVRAGGLLRRPRQAAARAGAGEGARAAAAVHCGSALGTATGAARKAGLLPRRVEGRQARSAPPAHTMHRRWRSSRASTWPAASTRPPASWRRPSRRPLPTNTWAAWPAWVSAGSGCLLVLSLQMGAVLLCAVLLFAAVPFAPALQQRCTACTACRAGGTSAIIELGDAQRPSFSMAGFSSWVAWRRCGVG